MVSFKNKIVDSQFCILFALCLPVTIACVDVMAISVAYNNIMQDFSGSIIKTQWVLSGYTIGTAAFLITIGKLADIHGRRRMLLLGVFLFSFSSLMAALSFSMNLLIISRFVQGIASAMMMTTVISIITYQFSPQVRGAIIAKWGISLGLGLAVGPFVGGVFIYWLNWRSIFIVNIPICLIAYLLISRYISESKDDKTIPKIDWLETCLLTCILISLVTILSAGSSLGWSSKSINVLIGIFTATLILFVFVERKKKNPIIDFILFKQPNFFGATFCGFISYFCMYAWLFIFGVYLQNTFEMSTLEAGLVCSSFSISFAFSSKMIGSVIYKLGNKLLIQFGFTLTIVAFIWMATITLSTNIWEFILMFFLLGTGITIVNAPSMTAATEYVPSYKTGIASGIIFTIRWLGGSVGIVITTIIFQIFSYKQFIQFLGNANNLSIDQKDFLLHRLSDANKSIINMFIPANFQDASLLMNQIKQSSTAGLSSACVSLAILAGLGLIFSTILIRSPEAKLQEKISVA